MKIQFLQELDQLIYAEILLKHVHRPEEEVMPKYDEDTPEGTELLVPDPYGTEMYMYWIMSKIDLLNLEMDKYNNDRALFENAYDQMHDWWNRTFMPIRRNRQLRI